MSLLIAELLKCSLSGPCRLLLFRVCRCGVLYVSDIVVIQWNWRGTGLASVC